MNEKDAKSKVCPQMSGGVYDSQDDCAYLHSENCIASDCMCWVWINDGKTSGCCGLAK